jgi:hypothetical protein
MTIRPARRVSLNATLDGYPVTAVAYQSLLHGSGILRGTVKGANQLGGEHDVVVDDERSRYSFTGHFETNPAPMPGQDIIQFGSLDLVRVGPSVLTEGENS